MTAKIFIPTQQNKESLCEGKGKLTKMKKLIVDRYEGQFTICEEPKEKRYFAIEIAEMPKDAKPGTVILISEDGVITVDLDETKRRRDRILEKQNKLKA